MKYPIYFFVKGDEYKFLGLFKTNIHLFGVEEPDKIFLFGTDKNARDLFSRVMYGSRVSLTMSLVGTPWIVIPAFFVIVTVLAFNFVGDAIRDAADPYSL